MSDEDVTIEMQEVPLDEASMAEFKKARADGKETATREKVAESDEEKPAASERVRVRGGFQAKIDRLVKQTIALEEGKTAAEKRAAELEAKLNGSGAENNSKTTDEPKREAFQTEADYIRALTRWEVKQEMKSEREAEEKKAAESQMREAADRYNHRMISLQAEDEEIKDLLKQDIKIPSAIEIPITIEMENGADVTVFLARNPEICADLMEMPPSRAIAEVWRISEKLASSDEEKEEKEVVPVEEKPARRAPAPIRPVSTGSSRSTIPLDKSDYQAYKKLRAQGRVQ